jgi:hypothetical protein
MEIVMCRPATSAHVSIEVGTVEIEICSVHVSHDTSSFVPTSISRKDTTKKIYHLIDHS